MTKQEKFKRINILLRDEQYQKVQGLGLNLSGLVRDLIDDRFSHKTIPLSVSPETRVLYDNMISNFGVSDAELEKHLLKAMDELLKEKTQAINLLREKLK